MTIREEIKKGRKEFLATATPKQKWQYFCDYYGLLTIVIILCTALITWVVVDTVTRPDVILNGLFVNTPSDRAHHADELGTAFLKEKKINTEENSVSFGTGITILASDPSSTYENSQAMMTQVAGGAIDFITGQNKQLLDYAYGGLFVDLRTVFSEEELETYEPYLHYIDEAVIEQRQALEDSMESYAHIELPDSSNPEEMERPIPVFFDVSGNEKMADIYGNTNDLIIGIAVNAPNPENGTDFIKYILN